MRFSVNFIQWQQPMNLGALPEPTFVDKVRSYDEYAMWDAVGDIRDFVTWKYTGAVDFDRPAYTKVWRVVTLTAETDGIESTDTLDKNLVVGVPDALRTFLADHKAFVSEVKIERAQEQAERETWERANP